MLETIVIVTHSNFLIPHRSQVNSKTPRTDTQEQHLFQIVLLPPERQEHGAGSPDLSESR